MFFSRRWILIAAVLITGVSTTQGLAQKTEDAQRVPTPDFEVGHSYNYQSGKNSVGEFGIVHGVMMTTPQRTLPGGAGGVGGIDVPGLFPPELPREFGTLHHTHIGGRMLLGDNVALVGVLQQPGGKSKYMYVVLIDYGKDYHGMGFRWGGPASQPGHVSITGEYFAAKATDSANSPSTDPTPQESQGKTNKASRGNARSAQSRANARAGQTRQGGANVRGGFGGGGFGGGGFGGAGVAGGGGGSGGIGFGGTAMSSSDDRNFRFKIAHEYEVQKSPFRLKNIELKLNEHEIKAGNPRVFLADYSGEKFKLTPVEVKFPEEAPDLQDTDQKTWAEAVKKTIDHLRENSSEVDQFMNKRTVQKMGGGAGWHPTPIKK